MVQFLKLKPTFLKFECQFDQEDQGQGHQFSNFTRHLDDQ